MLDTFSIWQEKLVPVQIDTLDRNEAILSLKNSNQKVTWPTSALPSGVTNGDTIFLKAFSNKELSLLSAEMVRKIISELIN